LLSMLSFTLLYIVFPYRTGAFHIFVVIEHSSLTFHCTCIMISSSVVSVITAICI
jgi:hypothetical protein